MEKYISDLLYHHDCVIVPNLGGFVTNYKPAYINQVSNTFYPPSKSISFNKNLKNNDGLLINYISEQTNKEYQIVQQLIIDEVALIHQQLKQKKPWKFSKIGTLYLNHENNILFEPQLTLNYLTDSFGLIPFQKRPIIRPTVEEKITKEIKERVIPIAQNETKRNKKWLVAAAITIPLTFFAIWIPSKYNLTENINYAKINPFVPESQPQYNLNNKQTNLFKEDTIGSIKEQLLLADENTLYYPIYLSENRNPIIVQFKEKAIEEPVSTYVETHHKELNYHVIGGCFSNKRNAKRMLKKLKKEGFDASIIGKRKGLWTVSYSSFVTRKEAVDALAKAQSHNSKAWILNYEL